MIRRPPQWPKSVRRQLASLLESRASARLSAVRMAMALRSLTLLIVAVGWVVRATAPALTADRVKHVAASSMRIC
ncbi:MAG TPA: hypothetical protein VHY18_06880 [Solirubrobacteraceae bacterium]|nr:hypothetical protein [Solirubrobacteraceae bacterium]